MILLIDNYDSFTWNLAQEIGGLGAEVRVVRNDEMSVTQIEEMSPEAIVISPGPGRPEAAGVSVEAVSRLSGRMPILGVCLGHQAIAAAHGADVVRARRVMHGKISPVVHNGEGIFEGIPSPFPATRYHSLVVDRDTLPSELEVVAWTGESEEEEVVQGVRHREHPTWGVQFHPESVSTEAGSTLLQNLLTLAGRI